MVRDDRHSCFGIMIRFGDQTERIPRLVYDGWRYQSSIPSFRELPTGRPNCFISRYFIKMGMTTPSLVLRSACEDDDSLRVKTSYVTISYHRRQLPFNALPHFPFPQPSPRPVHRPHIPLLDPSPHAYLKNSSRYPVQHTTAKPSKPPPHDDQAKRRYIYIYIYIYIPNAVPCSQPGPSCDSEQDSRRGKLLLSLLSPSCGK